MSVFLNKIRTDVTISGVHPYYKGGVAVLYIEKKRELVNYFKKIPIEKKQQLYRSVRSVVAMLVKVSKMTELYEVRDKIFDEFTETMSQNVGIAHNNLPYFSITTKKVGFYYQEKKIKLFDDGERKFRNIFLTNEIREIYFVKGVTLAEMRKFFSVIKETLNYTLLDYDFNTKLWDYGIVHIGTISDPDMGDPEPWEESGFKSEFEPWSIEKIKSLTPRQFHDLAEIVPEFKEIDTTPSEQFKEWAESKNEEYTVKRYLEKATTMIKDNPSDLRSEKLVGKICEYGVRNLQEGDFVSGVVYVNTLVGMAKDLGNLNQDLFNHVRNVLQRLTTEEFVNKIFEAAAIMEPKQMKSFSELLTLISTANFENVFMKIIELENKDIRLPSLEAIAPNFKDIVLAERLVKDPEWHVVRNFLYLLRFVYNEKLLPLVREVMNHQVRQIRVEAARVLSQYDADENFPYWEKAVFSPDEEVRLMAVENLVKVSGMESKHVLNEIFKPSNRGKFNLTDYERYIDRILGSKRREFYDLPGSLIFSENQELRLISLKCLNKVEEPSIISTQLKRRLKSPEFLNLDKNEIELLLNLIKGQDILEMLDILKFIYNLSGGFFNRKKYHGFKKAVFDFMKQKKSPAIKRWIEVAAKEGNKETKSIIEGR
jgi:hypothetical protein